MRIEHHERYGYSPITERPDFSWPNGARLAFYVALNVEHFSFGGGLGHTPTSLGPPPDQRNYAWREYGLRVGIWRIFDLMEELGLPLCHLLNASVCETAPQIVERIKARGDEVVGHGRTNSERQSEMDEPEEAALIEEATGVLTRTFGKPPEGWMGPWIAETLRTPDLLKEAGYRYVMDWPSDDQPFWMRTRSGPLLSVPYPIEVNDSPTMLSRMQSASDFARVIVDQFETMIEQSKKQPLVCGISLHTFVVGQPFRLAHLRRALTDVQAHPDFGRVWVTTPGAIARYAAQLPSGVIVGP
ncbi:MAG TPA: polysaccharide deacetylase family protein [Candidatus Acidoferrales bacterium]|nr:polysaccharide deacetylase family protein [Candidatus Acidoferrales bacterium]